MTPSKTKSSSSTITGGESDTKTLSTSVENEELKRKLRNVQEENVKLQAVVADLTQVNKRWQKYNNDRQIYVQKLLNTIQDQQEQLNKMGEQHAYSSSETKRECSKPSDETLQQDILRLKESERRLQEKVEVLEFQVKVNRDDWEAEHNEKDQVIKDKEAIQQRAALLTEELQRLKQSVIEKRLPKELTLLCRSCQASVSEKSDDVYPAHSKLYRTALHLSCNSPQWSEKSLDQKLEQLTTNELAIDGKGNEEDSKNLGKKCRKENSFNDLDLVENFNEFESSRSGSSLCSFKSNTDSVDAARNVSDIWNIKSSDACKQDLAVSYSRASTIPLIGSSNGNHTVQPSSSSVSSTSLMTEASNEPVKFEFSTNRGTTVTSFMKIPIVKSSSAPDSKAENNSAMSFRSSLDSFNTLVSTAPVALISAPHDLCCVRKRIDENTVDIGVETLTKEDIICPSCGSVFPPKTHLKFLDHFESCQRITL